MKDLNLTDDNFKRIPIPRKAKEKSVVHLENLAVIMEVIEATSAVEEKDILYEGKPKKVLKEKPKPNKKSKNKRIDQQKNIINLKETTHSIKKKSKTLLKKQHKTIDAPVLISNSSGLSHFMKLEERTDLLCSSLMDDPLGPDSFDNFQWVNVKEEVPDDVEICKVTLIELPLKVSEVKGMSDKSSLTEESNLPLAQSLEDEECKKSEIQDDEWDCEKIEIEDDDWDHKSFTEDSFADFFADVDNEETLNVKRKTYPQDCDLCGKTLSSIGSLRLHKFKKHKLKTKFTCDLCGVKFDYQREVVRHRNTTHRQEDGCFCCEVCAKRYSDYHSFLLHIKSHLSSCKEEEGSDKMCLECNKTFKDDESLKIHEILMHRLELREKIKLQEKNFVCHTCGKRFAFNCILRDHINLHTGSKPYLCQKCGKSFAQKATLKQHSKTHNDIRPFQCSECSLGFYSRSDLKKHLRKHTGEKPYACEVCGEKFSRSTHLSVHRRSHTGERPYVCDICERGFTKRGDVVRHRRIHTGELPYLCQTCGKAFRQSSQCANHIRSQHPDASFVLAKKSSNQNIA